MFAVAAVVELAAAVVVASFEAAPGRLPVPVWLPYSGSGGLESVPRFAGSGSEAAV